MLRTGIGRAARTPSACVTYTGADAARIIQDQNELNARRAGASVRTLHDDGAHAFSIADAFIRETPRYDDGASHWQLAYLHGVARSVAPARAHA